MYQNEINDRSLNSNNFTEEKLSESLSTSNIN